MKTKDLLRCRKYICLFIAMLLASKKAFNILTKEHLKTKKNCSENLKVCVQHFGELTFSVYEDVNLFLCRCSKCFDMLDFFGSTFARVFKI
jgi:hypothetical protein